MSEFLVKLRQYVDKMLGRQPTQPPATPAAGKTEEDLRDPGAFSDRAADEREARLDAVNKAADESDSKRPPLGEAS